MSVTRSIAWITAVFVLPTGVVSSADVFHDSVQPLLRKYCVSCHGGEDEVHGEVNFAAINTGDEVDANFELWEKAIALLREGTMPPDDELQPSEADKKKMVAWYQNRFVDSVQAHPGFFRPRRLSAHELRNTLHTLLGFQLDVAIMEAEQTVTEKSLVIKLLPTDPPGPSGFKNDTSGNPLTTVFWDQYSYLIDNALVRLFSAPHRDALQSYTGKIDGEYPNAEQAKRMLRLFARRAWRRPTDDESIAKAIAAVDGLSAEELQAALQNELKTILMSPTFLFRGLLMDVPRDTQQPVDSFELAERLSYFLWGDMPDEILIVSASDGTLRDPKVYRAQIDRMLASPKARNLAENMGVQWLSLDQIELVSNNPPVADALMSQPIDYLNFLFTERRPLMELIDSDTTFINPHTAKFYPRDRRQLAKYTKQKGIEVEALPNQRITLEQTAGRGGVLTMPGVLAMNRGPVLRGTWILERILGEHLPDPPADVGQVPANRRGESLTFRQRFELHRSNSTCAVCHDKIDPLGFALQAYDDDGGFIKSPDYSARKRKKKDRDKSDPDPDKIDTSGRLPSGESFDDFAGLQRILVTDQRQRVIRNVVRRMMSYALCRKLEINDTPVADAIVQRLQHDGTFGDLIHEIATSLPFQQTVVASR